MQHLLMDEYFWLTLSFLLFGGIVIRFGLPVFNGMLDSRILEIRNNLETAERLRIEAQEMLAQYQRKQRDAVKESEKIISDAKASAKKFQENVESEMAESMKRREIQLQERLKRMEQAAVQKIQSYAAELAISAATQIAIEKLDQKADAKLIDQSIANIENSLH